MKQIKILLSIIVVALISTAILFWLQSIKEPGKPIEPKNQFITKIDQEIEGIEAKPNSVFCKDYYREVTLNINNFYKENRFSKDSLENYQFKEIFKSNLYTAYSEKFINQAFYVLEKSNWKYSDRKFIIEEKNNLKNSKYLAANSSVDIKLDEIQRALSKYWEISRFIQTCKNFTYNGNNLTDTYAIDDVSTMINRAASYINNNLENKYVNNSTSLHNDLSLIPQKLFNKHVFYLDKKVDNWSNMWCNYNSHSDYSQNLNKHIKEEIQTLGFSTIYTGVNLYDEYNRLSGKWSADNKRAYNAEYPCKINH